MQLIGKLEGTICVDCVRPDGTRVRIGCCPFDCRPPNCPELEILRCETIALQDKFLIMWNNIPELCWQEFIIRDDTGQELARLPGSTNMWMLPCSELVALTGKAQGEICITCVD